MVVGHEPDPAVFLGRTEIRHVPAVESIKNLGVTAVFPDAVEQVEKFAVFLPVDGLQLNRAVFR